MAVSVDIDGLPKQNDILPSDIGDRFSGIVKAQRTHITKEYQKMNLVTAVEITAHSSPKKFVGKVYDNYHGWGTTVVAGSGFALAIHKLKGMGVKNPSELIGREVIFEKIPISESPNYRPSSDPEFVGEKYPRYYVVDYAT